LLGSLLVYIIFSFFKVKFVCFAIIYLSEILLFHQAGQKKKDKQDKVVTNVLLGDKELFIKLPEINFKIMKRIT
jgi:hypothetical protein